MPSTEFCGQLSLPRCMWRPWPANKWLLAACARYQGGRVKVYTKSNLPITIHLAVGEELLIFPDTLIFLHSKTPAASTGWISQGDIAPPRIEVRLQPDTRLYAAPVKLPYRAQRKLREMSGRIAYGEHNERLQECGKCECGGTIRYDEHLARICDDCRTFFGYKIVTDKFMNGRGEEEKSGGDDAWKVRVLEESYNREPVAHSAPRVGGEQLDIWWKERDDAYKHAMNQHRFDPNHKNDYVKHDTRKYKSGFIEDRICLIIRNNGNDGIEQRDICGRFKLMYGEDITYDTVKAAVKRMKKAGRICTTDISTTLGKRVMVRLIAKV